MTVGKHTVNSVQNGDQPRVTVEEKVLLESSCTTFSRGHSGTTYFGR